MPIPTIIQCVNIGPEEKTKGEIQAYLQAVNPVE